MGSDQNDGIKAPVKTIARAVKLAQPSDTIHLAPTTYYEEVNLSGKVGLPGQPIVVDGHGAVIEGSEPVRAAVWESLGSGLFRKVKLMPQMNAAIIGRWFFLWRGKMNAMGRTSKGPSAPLKKVEELQADEWTYAEAEDAFYIQLPDGMGLNEAEIRYPARANAVSLAGKGAHLVVRNITGTHVYNDGFNVHGDQVDTLFENIRAIECGDDGFSAHGTAECRILGFTSIGNSTGLCDTVSSVTHYQDVFIHGCHAYDVFFIGDSPHSIENALIESSAAYPLSVAQSGDHPQGGLSRVRLKNVLIRRDIEKVGDIKVTRNSLLEAENCTFIGLDLIVTPGAEMSLTKSAIAGDGAEKPVITIFAEAVWRGAENHYDIQSLRKGPNIFTVANFADYQKLTGGEIGSRYSPEKPAPGVGADAALLKKLRR